MIKEKIRRHKAFYESIDLTPFDKMLEDPTFFSGTMLRTFEPQFKHIRPLPSSLLQNSTKNENYMEVDEISGKHIKIYTFDSYFKELGM